MARDLRVERVKEKRPKAESRPGQWPLLPWSWLMSSPSALVNFSASTFKHYHVPRTTVSNTTKTINIELMIQFLFFFLFHLSHLIILAKWCKIFSWAEQHDSLYLKKRKEKTNLYIYKHCKSWIHTNLPIFENFTFHWQRWIRQITMTVTPFYLIDRFLITTVLIYWNIRKTVRNCFFDIMASAFQ